MDKKILFNPLKILRITPAGYFQKITFSDRILNFTILRFIPIWIKPNYLMILRFIAIPILIFLLIAEYVQAGLILFISVFIIDAIDGSLARNRKQVSKWGIVNDSIASKLTTTLVVAVLVTKYIHPILAFLIIGLEITVLYRYKKDLVSPRFLSRVKKLLEFLALTTLFIFVLSGVSIYLQISTVTLFLLIPVILLTLFIYKYI